MHSESLANRTCRSGEMLFHGLDPTTEKAQHCVCVLEVPAKGTISLPPERDFCDQLYLRWGRKAFTSRPRQRYKPIQHVVCADALGRVKPIYKVVQTCATKTS